MADFHGVFPYLVSPIDAGGRILTDVLGKLCVRPHQGRRAGLTPLGSTGEFAYLNREQRDSVVQATIEAARKARAGDRRRRLDRDCGRGRRRRRTTRGSAPTASWRSSKPTFRSRMRRSKAYFRAIADAVDIPVVLYTNPQFQRSDLSLDVIAQLASIRASATSRMPRPIPGGCCRS